MMKKPTKTISLGWLFIIAFPVFITAQNYHAIQGSSYAGSLGVHNNPASIVSTPFRWDITLAGFQAKTSNNMVQVWNYSLLSAPSKSEYYFTEGQYARKGIASVNANLLNSRFAIGRNMSIAFGANFRGLAEFKTSEYDYADTAKGITDFLRLNERNQPLSGNAKNSAWIELYGSFAMTILETSSGRLNAGATLKVSRGISGAYGSGGNIRYNSITGSDPAEFLITDGTVNYGYSSNYDRWKDENSQQENMRNFLKYTEGGLSFDLGAEWLVKPMSVASFGEDDYYDYDWKLGLSILDAGLNQFKYGTESRIADSVKPGVTDFTLIQKFDSSISSLADFNDSLATIVNIFNPQRGIFKITNPMRLVLNVDRYITKAFFVNAELSINLSPALSGKNLYVKEMNVFTLTPRWETRRFGAYMPIHITTEGNFWVGGAVKAGPLLFGLHNLGYIFSKKTIQKGGGYLAIIIRASSDAENKKDKRLDCPPLKSR